MAVVAAAVAEALHVPPQARTSAKGSRKSLIGWWKAIGGAPAGKRRWAGNVTLAASEFARRFREFGQWPYPLVQLVVDEVPQLARHAQHLRLRPAEPELWS